MDGADKHPYQISRIRRRVCLPPLIWMVQMVVAAAPRPAARACGARSAGSRSGQSQWLWPVWAPPEPCRFASRSKPGRSVEGPKAGAEPTAPGEGQDSEGRHKPSGVAERARKAATDAPACMSPNLGKEACRGPGPLCFQAASDAPALTIAAATSGLKCVPQNKKEFRASCILEFRMCTKSSQSPSDRFRRRRLHVHEGFRMCTILQKLP
jgi:hypothetical protein